MVPRYAEPMTPQEILDRIPSVQELLEHPSVRGAAERWNRSSVAAKLRSAIAEVGAEASRRAESWQGVTAAEIVESVVRRIDPTPAAPTTRVINATGRLLSDEFVGTPLPDAALEAAAAFAAGYTTHDARPESRIASLLGADRVWVASNHAAAIAACLSVLARDTPLVVGRRDMAVLGGGVRFETVCRSVGVTPHEVGVAERTTLDDYLEGVRAHATDDDPSAIVYIVRRSITGSIEDVVRGLKAERACVVVDVGEAPPIDLSGAYGTDAVSAAGAIGDGADMVILRGEGMLGGPTCGVVAGVERCVNVIAADPSNGAVAASTMIRSMTAASADLFHEPARLRFNHPLFELLSAPIENLRTRAERLAPQIAESPRIAEAEALAISPSEQASPRFESWGIAVKPADADAERLRQSLSNADPAIHGITRGDGVQLDLRTVFPRQDSALVDAFA